VEVDHVLSVPLFYVQNKRKVGRTGCPFGVLGGSFFGYVGSGVGDGS